MKKTDRFFLLLSCFLITSEVLKQLALTLVLNGGEYDWWYFPFQLCSLPLYLLPIYLCKKSANLRQILLTFFMTYNLLGGIAVFFDTSGMHYPLAILTVHSYLWHILLILLGIYAGILLLHEVRPTWRFFFESTLLYGFFCCIAECLNLVLSPLGELNMFYISPRFRMNQAFFCVITDHFGNLVGIISYIGGTILGAAILFIVWRTLQKCTLPKNISVPPAL